MSLASRNREQLIKSARTVLTENDRGGYTIPTDGLYPFQWNWDSAICALGWQTFDEHRAWQEIERLLQGQWSNGMVPHMVFHQYVDDYFPGADFWGVDRQPQTSSITQPPILATVVKQLHDNAIHHELTVQRVKGLLPKLIAYHHYFYRSRDPEGESLVVSFHPWESGMDNSPSWDLALSRVPRFSESYNRTDLQLVEGDERPLKSEYDRYLFLVNQFKKLAFCDQAIASECAYQVQDFGFNALLLRATEDLLSLCASYCDSYCDSYCNSRCENFCEKSANNVDKSFEKNTQLIDQVKDLRESQRRAEQGLAKLWSSALGHYCSRDRSTDELIGVATSASYLGLFAGLASAEQAAILARSIEQSLASAPYGIASTHPHEPSYESQRYWRGPSWLHINWMIYEGCERYGYRQLAERIKAVSLDCITQHGFWEYYDSNSGDGCGGDKFSWTAAIALYWLLDT